MTQAAEVQFGEHSGKEKERQCKKEKTGQFEQGVIMNPPGSVKKLCNDNQSEDKKRNINHFRSGK